jgi:hypothetical protein
MYVFPQSKSLSVFKCKLAGAMRRRASKLGNTLFKRYPSTSEIGMEEFQLLKEDSAFALISSQVRVFFSFYFSIPHTRSLGAQGLQESLLEGIPQVALSIIHQNEGVDCTAKCQCSINEKRSYGEITMKCHHKHSGSFFTSKYLRGYSVCICVQY